MQEMWLARMSQNYMGQRNRNQNFILALWYEGDAVRYRLENPRTGEQFGFVDAEALFAFLKQRVLEEKIADELSTPSLDIAQNG